MPVRLWPEGTPAWGAIEAAFLEAGSSAIAPALKRLKRGGITAHGAVRVGLPPDTILEEARRTGAQAIVMGTRGAGALRGFALGSVALRVVHGDTAPVVLVKPGARLPVALGRRLRVLVAMDASPPALRAVKVLVDWQRWLGEMKVELLHVQPSLTLIQQLLPPHADVIAQWGGRSVQSATAAASLLLKRGNVQHRIHCATGETAPEIVRFADKHRCEMIVLGTRGMGAAHHALIGSVALRAASSSSVPVLLVP